jgi:hypothetical protein
VASVKKQRPTRNEGVTPKIWVTRYVTQPSPVVHRCVASVGYRRSQLALRCSVIVCAHNEAEYLAGCLHALRAQSRPPDESAGAILHEIKRQGASRRLFWVKTLVRAEKNWPSVRQALRANVDVALTLFRNGYWQAPTARHLFPYA